MEKFEEQMAHIMRTVDDLSDIVAAQQNDIDRLNQRVEMLMRREGEREASGSGGIILGEERPPHY